MELGQVVFSKKGRDKGKPFVVMHTDGEYVFLTDGKLRPMAKPKKKKVKHIQPLNKIFDVKTAQKAGGLTDACLRKWLIPFLK